MTAGAPLPAWHPEPGEVLVGYVHSMGLATGDYGVTAYLDLHDEDSSEPFVRVYAGRAALRGQLTDQNPQAGDAVRIDYLGMRISRSGREVHAYRTIVHEVGARTGHGFARLIGGTR